MSVENEKRIAELREQIDRAKQAKYRYEARLEELQKQRERLLDELRQLNVRPEDLESEIQRLQTEVDGLLRGAAALLPADLPGRSLP